MLRSRDLMAKSAQKRISREKCSEVEVSRKEVLRS